MRRFSLAMAMLTVVAGCSMDKKSADASGTGSAKGEQGVFYFVNLFSTPVGGVITSDVAGTPAAINCGASAVTVPKDAAGQVIQPPTYQYTMVGSACGTAGQTRFAWNQTVVLTATPVAGKAFLGWAGDCTDENTAGDKCTLVAGADKTVVAIFGVPGMGHTNFLDPALHGPAYAARINGAAGALDCAACHGEALTGQGIAPSCASCHAMPAVPAPVNPAAQIVLAKSGLVAAITSVTPGDPAAVPATTTVIKFTMKDGANRNVDVTGVGFAGGSGKNQPIDIRFGLVNFATDASGIVSGYMTSTGAFAGNTSTIWSTITSMSVTNGVFPSATAFTYPEGTLTQAGVACTLAAPCTCTPTNACTYSGTVGARDGVACTVAAPCTCSSAHPCAPALRTTNAPGALTYDAATGVYTYTAVATDTRLSFPAAGSTWASNTQEMWMQTSRREWFNAASVTASQPTVWANFTPVNPSLAMTAAGVPAAKREVVTSAKCNACHAGFIGAAFHGGGRVEGPYCAVCHYDGRSSGVDRRVFAHRAHASGMLTKVTTGTATSGYQIKVLVPGATAATARCSTTTACTCTVAEPCVANMFNGIAATYPQDPKNCNACHGGAQGSQWNTKPSIAACVSCHDSLAAYTATSILAHDGADRTNAECATCHTPANIIAKHLPVQSAIDSGSAALASAPGQLPAGALPVTYEIQSVAAVADAGGVLRPEMVFKLKLNGADVDFGTYGAATNPELITGTDPLAPKFVGSPTVYFVWSQPQDGITAPADFNASSSMSLKSCWSVGTSGTAPNVLNCTISRDAATGFYTMRITTAIIPATARMLTGGLGYTSPMVQTDVAGYPYNAAAVAPAVKGGFSVPTVNLTKVATGFTGRRVVVDNAKCTKCHAQLGVDPTFHGGGRNDAPTCSWCHTPNRTSSAWSANASTFVHGIHGASARTVGFNWHASCGTGATWVAATNRCEITGALAPYGIWYPEVEYPGVLANCSACHTAGGFDFSANAAAIPNLLWSTVASGTSAYAASISLSPYVAVGTVPGAGFGYNVVSGVVTSPAATTLVSSPMAAACFSCHDSAAARTHIEAAGGAIYKARGAGFTATAETCLDCHGTGKIFAIDAVHK